MAFNDSSYGLFQGQVFIRERTFNGGPLGGFEFMGDTDRLEITPKQTFDNIMESQTGLGLTAAHILTGTEVGLSMQALDIKMSNWVRAMWGTASGAVAAGSVTGETLTLYNGLMTPLKHPGVSALTLTAGATPLVLGTDYTLDAANGTVTILIGSTVVPPGTPTAATAAYTKAAYTGKVEAFTTGQRYYTVRLQGRNVAQNNQPVIVNINQIAFDMAKALSLIAKQHQTFAMDGMCLQDTSVPLPQSATDLSQFFNVIKG